MKKQNQKESLNIGKVEFYNSIVAIISLITGVQISILIDKEWFKILILILLFGAQISYLIALFKERRQFDDEGRTESAD